MSANLVRTIEADADMCRWLDELSHSFPPNLTTGHEVETFEWVESQLADIPTSPQVNVEHSNSDQKCVPRVLRIIGLPLPRPVPPTPSRYQSTEFADVHMLDIPHIAIASMFGYAFGNSLVRGGRIICDIFSRGGFEDKKDSAFGSEREFDYHADGAVFPSVMPDLLSLRCVRNRCKVPTLLSTVDQNDFDADTWDALHDPVYTIYYEQADNSAHHLSGTPLVSADKHGVRVIHYYGRSKLGFTADAAIKHIEAAKAFRDTLRQNTIEAQLDPGEILIFNNRTFVHGRASFSDRSMPQSERRWMRRIFCATRPELIASIKSASHRIITPAETLS